MDHTSFRMFYEKTVPSLRAYAIRSSGEVDLADDIVQEAFLRFLKSAPATLSEPQMRSYLYRTVETLILNRWRRTQREKSFTDRKESARSTTNTPETADDIPRAFSKLDLKQRLLLWLAYVEGFDHKEIAATVNIQEKSVRVLLYRARQTLMGILKSAGIGPEVL